MPWNVYHANSSQPKFRWRTTTPITFSHALLFSISDSALTHNCFFFCLPRSKKKTCLGQQYNHESCRSSVTRNKRRRGYEPCLVRKQGGRRREKVTVWGHNNVFSSLTPFLHRLLARFSRSSRLDKKLQFWSTFRLSRSIEKNWSLLKLKPRP